MGSCVSSSSSSSSSHKKNKSSSASDSVVKLAAFISTSPLNTDVIKSATLTGINPPIDSAGEHKEEEMIFFDSRGWLDSDCEDDFMSVDGEFTPSRGTTLVHHKFCDQTGPQGEGEGEEKPHVEEEEEEEEEEASPNTDSKKKLIELFKETQDEDEDYVAQGKSRRACIWLRTPVRSSAPATPSYNNNKERLPKFMRVRSAAAHGGGCVPRLVSCSSFTDRRRNIF